MKTKKVIFTYKEARPPKEGEWFLDSLGQMARAFINFDKVVIYEIYTREEIEEQWTPKEGELYYFPCIDLSCLYAPAYYCGNNDANNRHRLKHGLAFPTKELAIEKAKEILEKL